MTDALSIEPDQAELRGYTTSKVITTIQGFVAEEEFYDSDGNIVGYFAYGYYDPAYPFQGSKEDLS